MKNKNTVIDIVCVSLVAAIFGGVALLNITQTERPTVSEAEKRKLATMPKFSYKTLADGTYFSDVAAFFSDTFIARDQLVGLSKKMDTLKGFDYSIGGEDNFVLLSPVTGTEGSNDGDDFSDKLNEAFDSLENRETESDTTIDSDGMSSASGEIVDETDPEESFETETDTSGETDNESAQESDTETEPDPDAPIITGLHISKSSLKLTVGSGSVLYATVDSSNNKGAAVSWSISDKSIATISMNENGGLNVKGVSVGKAILTCSYGDEFKEICNIEVTEIDVGSQQQNDGHADFLASGLFIYGDAVYTQAWYNSSASSNYAQTVSYYKKLFGESVNVSVVIAPVSSMVVDNAEVQAKVQDQDEMIQKIGSHMDSSINFVNPYSEMYEHRDEYLFFKSDHHWTQRGAYYAYSAFAKSVGLEPKPLDEFNYEIRNDSYSGSLYSWTNDERVKNFIDTIEVFNPGKEHTMTVTSSGGYTNTYNSSIVSFNKTYVTFIAGDNPYTVINVPDNPQEKNILVLKDSFGNAFVPFLCEHYGNIIVVDVRYSNFNIYEQLKDYGLTDIVFVNNAQAVTSSWAKMYLSAVGVN